jgi:hypothetical protein
MAVDPIPEDVRTYLREHFHDVTDEPSRPDRYVFGVTVKGIPRKLKVDKSVFTFPADDVRNYLREFDVACQLESSDIEIKDLLKK